jgi:putative radical SAM enzyme (TIGR03279 family)
MQGMPKRGIRLLEVARGSVAEEIGLMPGDEILAINGHELPDELALKFHLSEETVNICVLRPSGEEEHFELSLPDGTGLGVKVEDFQTKTCNNSCLFCFIDQLPPGVRPALRLKDDDFRLSFLHGNYITLTNLPEKELDRIIEQRLSPLYVSVHATDPELRTRILGRTKKDDLDRKMRKLTDGNIRLHCQIVLIPGINDGECLKKTVFDLLGFYPGVESVAIVPLGLSAHGAPKERLNPVTPDFCRAVVHQAAPWQDYFRAQIGRTFAYLADEFYLHGGEDLPRSERYDDFAQIEDGIGMVRSFLDEFEIELARRRKYPIRIRGTIATGTLFFGTLRKSIDQINEKFGARLQVLAVENKFMGKSVTIAGLLGGQDIAAALDGREAGDFILVPSEAISRTDGIFVDDISLKDLSERIGIPVYPGGKTVRDFFRLLFKIGRR